MISTRRVSGGTASACALVLAFSALIPVQPARADNWITGNGAFHSSSVHQSTRADPCDRSQTTDVWRHATYYEDMSVFAQTNPDIFLPEAQCQGTGEGPGNAPQVVSCLERGYCMRFATAADSDGSDGYWNRSELAIGHKVLFRQWHFIGLKFKFPNSIQDPTPIGDEELHAPFFAQFFHQEQPTGRPVSVSGAIGGLRLLRGRKWGFSFHNGVEGADGTEVASEYVSLLERDFQPEQWTSFQLLLYLNPEGKSYMYYSIDQEPIQSWSGKFGTMFARDRGGVSQPFTDVKVGIYTQPMPVEVRVYLDDINLDEYVMPFAGDGIVLTGASNWSTIPTLTSKGDGTVTVTNFGVAGFPTWSSWAGVNKIAGDFNADGQTDIALTGPSDWRSIPVAYSSRVFPGTFTVSNVVDHAAYADWARWSSMPGVKTIAGDFDADGYTDIALTGVSGWTSIPIAFSRGEGAAFQITNTPVTDFGRWASTPGVELLAADFDGGGGTELVATGVPGWTSMPFAKFHWVDRDNGVGSFTVFNVYQPTFSGWSSRPGVKRLTGDFDGDRLADIALLTDTLAGVPLALSNGDGTYRFKHASTTSGFSGMAQLAGMKAYVGDFSGDGLDDIALTGSNMWAGIALATSNRTSFTYTFSQDNMQDFYSWSAMAPARIVGDFNHDGKADLMLTGVPGWHSVPIALSYGNGGFGVYNAPTSGSLDFGSWASAPGAVHLGSHHRM